MYLSLTASYIFILLVALHCYLISGTVLDEEVVASTIYINNTPYIKIDNNNQVTHNSRLENQKQQEDINIHILQDDSQDQQPTSQYYYNPCIYGRTSKVNDNPLIFNSSQFNDPFNTTFKDVYIVQYNQVLVIDFKDIYNDDPPFFCVNGTLEIKSTIKKYVMRKLQPISGIYIFETGQLVMGHVARVKFVKNRNLINISTIETSHQIQYFPSIISFGGVIKSIDDESDNNICFQRLYPEYVPEFLIYWSTIRSVDALTSTSFPITDGIYLTRYSFIDTLVITYETKITLPPGGAMIFYNHSSIEGEGSIHLLMGTRCNLNRMLFVLSPSSSSDPTNTTNKPPRNGISVQHGSTLVIDNSIFYLNESMSGSTTLRSLISVDKSTLHINSCYFNHAAQSLIVTECGTESIYSFNNTFVGIPPNDTQQFNNINTLNNNNNNNNNDLYHNYNHIMNGSAITTISPTLTSNNDRYYGSFPSSAIHIYQINNRLSITGLMYDLYLNDFKYHHSSNINNHLFDGIQQSIFNHSSQQSSITFDLLDNNNNNETNTIRMVQLESNQMINNTNSITTQQPINYLSIINSTISNINNINNYTWINNEIITNNNNYYNYNNATPVIMMNHNTIMQHIINTNTLTIPLPPPSTTTNTNYSINIQFEIIPTWIEYYQLFNEYIDNQIYLEEIAFVIQLSDNNHLTTTNKYFDRIDQSQYLPSNNHQQQHSHYINATFNYRVQQPLPPNNISLQFQWNQSPDTIEHGDYLDINIHSIDIYSN